LFLTSGQETYQAGETVFKEGSYGKTVYIVSSGRIEISKVARGKKVVVETLGPGSLFGMMTFIDPSSPRSATVVALEDTVLDIVDKNFLDKEFNQITSDFRQLLVTLVRRLVKTTNDFVMVASRLEPQVTGTIRISFKKESDFFKSYISNLAKGGLFVKTQKVLPVDTLLNLELTLPRTDRAVHTTGKVIWTRAENMSSDKMPPGMGIQFVYIDPEDERLLKNYMAAFQSS
jgi:CRP/FNR family cyclic AMP-dependent transcriptional regulator